MFNRLPESPDGLGKWLNYAIVCLVAIAFGSALVAGVAKIVSSLKRELSHSVDSFARGFSMRSLSDVDSLIYFGLWLIFILVVIKIALAVAGKRRR